MDYGLFIDIFVGIVIVVSALIAFLRGFIREVLTIFGIAGGLLFSYVGGPFLIPSMRGWLGVVEGKEEEAGKLFGLVPYPMVVDALAYGAVFIVVVIILSIVSHFLAEFVKNIGLGALDRTFGVVFGIARGVLVLGLMYLPFYYGLLDKEMKKDLSKSSASIVYLEATSKWVTGFLPEDMEKTVEDGVEAVEEASQTRKKLEELGVLEGQKADNKDAPKDGYTPEFREQMNDLFENNADTTPEYNE